MVNLNYNSPALLSAIQLSDYVPAVYRTTRCPPATIRPSLPGQRQPLDEFPIGVHPRA